MKTIVVNIRNGDEYDVYIGRPSIWGNPFIIGKDGTRQEVVDKYREYALSNREIIENLSILRGKRLGCYCSPLKCHGDVLKELSDGKS